MVYKQKNFKMNRKNLMVIEYALRRMKKFHGKGFPYSSRDITQVEKKLAHLWRETNEKV